MAIPAVQPMRATLYVGDLDASVTEADLNGVFLQFASQSIRLCRDRITHRSLRYAYVNFSRTEDAELALRQLNHTLLNGKPMRIMWSNRNPYSRKAAVGNLFVKNLESFIGPAQLERVFAKFGTVISCKVVYDESSGQSKCFGFVQMSTQEEAQVAISALHDNPSTGISKLLYVGNFVKKNMNGAQEKKNNLYIKNLEGDVTNEILNEKFSEFGKVVSAVVMKDNNGKSKEFGFVCFENFESAEKALEAMNGFKWGMKELHVSYAQKKTERKEFLQKKFGKSEDITNKYKGYGVYVKNLDESVDEKTFEELFAKCGNILYKRILLDGNKISRGFGFVYFSSIEEATNAIKTINGTELKSKKINVMHVLPKEKLKKSGTNKNNNKNSTGTGTKNNNPTAPVTAYAYMPVQQPYYVPNSYVQNLNIPFTNMYNVQQQQQQNVWANYNYNNYNYSYNYVPYTAQPVHSKSGYQGYDPYYVYNLQQINNMQGNGWNKNNTGFAKSGSLWNNTNSIFGSSAKQMGRNHNNNQKKWMVNKAVGPRKSKAPLVK
ncbi:hypothetical protein LUZ60_013588 [Juncus effusus]|nr:hypothetical protein LUZ60_013588 [Juncus effusus]